MFIKIEDNKIIKCTDNELFEYWMKLYDDLISYPDYKSMMKEAGVIITEDD